MRTRIAPLALVPLLVLTGCSSGSGTKQALTSTPTPTVAATTSTAPGTAATTAPSATASAGPASAAPSKATTTTASTAATTAASSAPITTVAPGKAATSKATPPGVYTSDTSGTVSAGALGTQSAKGTQTLTISPLKGDTQHSNVHADQGDTDQDLLVRDSGTYIASLKLSSIAFGGSAKEFHPSPAVLLLPDPAKVGTAWAWSAVSTDGKTHVKATNKITKTDTVTVGGKAIATVVVQTHLVVSGDVSYDAQVTTWYAPAYRLPVKDHTLGNGSFNGTAFKTDISTLLRSVKPA